MKKFILFAFIFVFMISLVVAVPPVTLTKQFASGFGIVDSPQERIEINKDYQINFFVLNLSDGMDITGTDADCTFYLSDNTGALLTYIDVPYAAEGYWTETISWGNFTETGEHYYGIKCNSTTLGGSKTGTYIVTPTGDNNIFTFQIFLYIFLFALCFLGFIIKNEWVVILSGIGLIMLGIFSYTQGISDFRNQLTNLISLVTIAFGALISIGMGIEVINDG